ncbi:MULTISPECIES: Fic family protein [Pseudomonas]|jgi:cell filamentation protein|uniref:Fic/DOC family protein n=1 Tax=Pseudomonas TaxID=286 RepID=UPI000F05640A|nr:MULTISPECIES: Fic family protein [Pseudomonas]QXH73805.1 Fic family protein [Pseudomonas atacamensis]RRW52669.1 cell filamentation protein Fic [Pseudomonas moraviensis]UVL14916.1 Fic family protein [Pseudomonas atacamensis]
MVDRYEAEGAQGSFQAGSDEQVLSNKLGISDPEEMDDAELTLLEKLYQQVLIERLPARSITVQDLRDWHRYWLGNIYPWAGEIRAVNLGKDGFFFAAAPQIPRLLEGFEKECLAEFTPCKPDLDENLIHAIAVTHVEFILIHPFREGNGRLSRLLADVMAVQAGYVPLDYSSWERNKEAYFAAINQGLNCNYQPMEYWVRRALWA